jgi:hypothetical protein
MVMFSSWCSLIPVTKSEELICKIQIVAEDGKGGAPTDPLKVHGLSKDSMDSLRTVHRLFKDNPRMYLIF